jgi:hypothetical protein
MKIDGWPVKNELKVDFIINYTKENPSMALILKTDYL